MHESSARKSGNPFDIQVRDAQRRKGLSSPDERQAVAADVAALGTGTAMWCLRGLARRRHAGRSRSRDGPHSPLHSARRDRL